MKQKKQKKRPSLGHEERSNSMMSVPTLGSRSLTLLSQPPRKSKKKLNASSQRTSRSVASSKRKMRKSGKKTTKRKRVVRKSKKRRWSSFKNVLVELTLVCFVFSLLLFPVFQFVLAVPKARGYAMSPTIQDGTRALVYRKGKIKRFSLIYFNVPQRKDGTKNIRRVIGLPGEKVVYKDDHLYINDEEKVERFLSRQLLNANEEKYILTKDFSLDRIDGTENGRIPLGYYLVLGDNRTFSVDSRDYGFVSETEIIGTVEAFF